jgi:hypothetical protein
MTSGVTRPVSVNPTGTAIARWIMVLGLSKGITSTAAQIAAQLRDTPQVQACLEHAKAAVPAATTTNSTWAEPLKRFGLADEALGIARGMSIVGAMESRMRRVPFLLNVPRQTGTGTGGAWIGEGSAVPIVSFAYDTVRLPPKRPGLAAVVTDELFRLGDRTAERTIRESTIGAHTQFLDEQFLLPSVTATDTTPASITSSAMEITSSGTSAAALAADLGAMVAAITTSGRGLVWIMRPTTAAQLAIRLGGAANDVPRTLFGLPMILSGNSPEQIALVDAAEIAYADEGDFEIDVSREATIEMLDNPTNNAATGTGTTMVSMFQANSTCFKVMRWVNWEVVRTGAVSYMEITFNGSPD